MGGSRSRCSGGIRVERSRRAFSLSLWRNSRLVHMEGMDGLVYESVCLPLVKKGRGLSFGLYIRFFSIYPFSSGSTDGLNTDVYYL